jgi:hypothetical protein
MNYSKYINNTNNTNMLNQDTISLEDNKPVAILGKRRRGKDILESKISYKVDMSKNNLDDEATNSIYELFENNFLNATTINFSNNNFGTGIVDKIIKLMSKCENLVTIDISGNKLTEADEDRLIEAKKQYPKLTIFLGPAELVRT